MNLFSSVRKIFCDSFFEIKLFVETHVMTKFPGERDAPNKTHLSSLISYNTLLHSHPFLAISTSSSAALSIRA